MEGTDSALIPSKKLCGIVWEYITVVYSRPVATPPIPMVIR